MSLFKRRRKTLSQLQSEIDKQVRELDKQHEKAKKEERRRKLKSNIKFVKQQRRKLKYRKIYGLGGRVKKVGIKTGRALTSKKARKVYKETGKSLVSISKDLIKEYKKVAKPKRKRKKKRRRRKICRRKPRRRRRRRYYW